MKTIGIFAILVIITSFSPNAISSSEWESYEMVNRLLSLPGPSEPVIYDNFVIFTANSDLRRVGVAFAHENFANIYWFTRLLVPQDRRNPIILPGEKVPSPYADSGMQFHVYQVPDHIRELEYRLIINGLWTIDPINPVSRRDSVTGLSYSILNIPSRPARYSPLNGLPEGLSFSFRAPPGEIITIGGSFNGWDPFMYELKESPAGVYSINIPLPPGTYQYVFFHRGERWTDPYNPRRIYSRNGMAASEIVVP